MEKFRLHRIRHCDKLSLNCTVYDLQVKILDYLENSYRGHVFGILESSLLVKPNKSQIYNNYIKILFSSIQSECKNNFYRQFSNKKDK